MIYKNSCSALINAVVKYLNFRSSDSKLENVTCKFTAKIALRYSNFSKNFTISVEQRYSKMHPDGCFWWKLYFGNSPKWLLLNKFIVFRNIFRSIVVPWLHIFYISYCDMWLQFVIFNPWKLPWNWIAYYRNSFVISPGLLYHLIRRDYGGLANEAFTSNLIVSLKQ